MKILGIETSCDETALAIVECEGLARGRATAEGGFERPQFKIVSEALNSQTKIHEKYGGVYPMMAKREHSRNLVPLLKNLLMEAEPGARDQILEIDKEKVKEVLQREPELLQQFLEAVPRMRNPNLDAIAVTVGPGLEPALWVGVNFAKALGMIWNLPVIPTNHMEGHIAAALLPPLVESRKSKVESRKIEFPALALLISGGHTELVLIKEWQDYKTIGQTRDDAVGEAYDKVARMMELPYPGGPEISRLAEQAKLRQTGSSIFLPRPMIKSKDYDFSFAGLKTAVLYTIRKMSDEEKKGLNWKAELAQEFEDAVTEVLISKTKRAIEEFNIKTLIVGGGVIANDRLRRSFKNLIKDLPGLQLMVPALKLTTDNAIMIAMAGYFNYLSQQSSEYPLIASGNLRLD